MSDVTLSDASRTNLLQLQSTLTLLNRTNYRLSTGNAVNGATDNAVKFFASQSLTNRANDLATRKDQIDQSVSLLTATQNGLDGVLATLAQIRGLVVQAQSATSTVASSISTQIDTLSQQLDNIINDASYQGQNLLNSSSFNVTIQFSSVSTSTLSITAHQFLILTSGASSSIGLFTTAAGSTGAILLFTTALQGLDTLGNLRDAAQYGANSGASAFSLPLQIIDQATSGVQAQAAVFGGNNTFLTTRLNFTSSYSNTLIAGAGKLTLADINQEGANAVALQTRQQLGIQALSFTGQSELSVLQLFR